ncbi:MAG TPA: hypothetical protein VKZ98_12530 [Aquaticitalea sp.]|nr:hypothetical protein [Aquaticitalea sp.]
MKTITSLLLICFGVLLCQAQDQLKLSIKKGSDAPNYEKEHSYLLEIANTGSKIFNANITIKNIECSNIKEVNQTDFNQEIWDKAQQNRMRTIAIQPGTSIEFYVKLSIPAGAKLNTWNCAEIVAMSNEDKILSNSITIESLIPNPNNNN